ncbi:cytochrome P450 76A2 [Vigna radiata var. radiata]|uniref:Cytochrome P450 76A2 n=1 Tax=Vigna radiata var. radiata TaxID=3916 RepID=A0A1S3TPA3_VIGRR|nr:cytochrome P450 76A2 [Vigna radiata var. radiata]
MALTSEYFSLFLLLLLSVLFIFLLRRKTAARNRRLPPGPPGWPIFGNMFQLGDMPHRTLTELRAKHGPVLWLQIGAMKTMVILSAEAAAVFFKHHDHAFADRTITETMRVHNYNKSSLALAPYGPYWRLMRRLVTVDMLVAKRINETAPVRRKCVNDMITWLTKEAEKVKEGDGVHVARFVFLMSFNLLGNLMLSRDLFDPDSEDGSEFFAAMMGLMEWSGHANVADMFPWLRRLDPQGLRRKMNRDMSKALEIASKFVKQRLEDKKTRDFLDVLIDFQSSNSEEALKITDKDLNIFILEIFLAGSETTSSTIEWTMMELLRNPEWLEKVKSELDRVVGRERKFEESDIDNLPYLQAVIKETLRLHPPIPFLVPRKAIENTKFMGYDIPKDTQVLVNAWAIGRDPSVWEQPLEFKPQRFVDDCKNIDYKGTNFGLIPFGSGRRMCAGVPLAHRILHLVLGSLLHEFDWKLESHVTPSTLDTRERLGITMRKLQPLLAVPKLISSSSSTINH